MIKRLKLKNMKRILYVFAIVLAMTGCNKLDNSIEGRITKAMEEYAKNNFDDPRDLNEIIHIERVNVYDIDSLARYTLEKSKEIDSLVNDLRSQTYDSTMLSMFKASPQEMNKMMQKVNESERTRLIQLFMQLTSYASSDYLYNRLSVDKAFDNTMQSIDSILSKNTFYPISEYEIKIRKNTDDGLKLQSYYTSLCDTTTRIIISDHKINTSELEGESLYLKNQIEELIEYGQKKVNFATEEKKTMDETVFMIGNLKL